MKYLLIALGLMAFLTAGCVSPDMQGKMESLSARQDSILTVLKKMENQTEFIAKKVGWEPPEDTLPKEIPLADSYYQGASNPVMTIVEFSDFQCPYCAGVAPTLDSLAKTYPEKIRIVFKHFPLNFHKQARSAHAAALAAGQQGKFYEYRYKLAGKFRELGDTTYINLAAALGLNIVQFKEEMKLTPQVNQIIERDMALGRELGVRGTPTLFANGKKVQDRSFRGFEQLLKQYGG